HVQLRVTNLSGANAVVSGLFFDPVALPGSASSVKSDTTTQGNWKGIYGTGGYDLSQDPSAGNPSLPAYATVNLIGQNNFTWAASTADVRALQKAGNPADRL